MGRLTPDAIEFPGIIAAGKTNYPHRRPSIYAGADGWSEWSVTNPGTIDPQPIIDAEIAAAKGALDFHLYYYVPPIPIFNGDPLTQPIGMNVSIPARTHLASAHKTDVKMAVLMDPFWIAYPNASSDPTWPHQAAIAADVAAMFADPAYMRINGLPFFGLYSASSATAQIANWNAFKAAIGPCYIVCFGSINPSVQNTVGARAGTNYGINGGAVSGNGRHPWSDQRLIDRANMLNQGVDRVATITLLDDPRARFNTEAIAWADIPTPADLDDDIDFMIRDGAKILFFGEAINELGEGGPHMSSSVQYGAQHMDRIRVKRGTLAQPASLTHTVGVRQAYCAVTGTWTAVTALAGAWDSNELTSSTTNDTIALPVNHSIVSNASTASIVVMGKKGPDRGIVEVLKNGVSQGTFDMYAVGAAQHQSIATVSCAPGDTLTARVTGTKNASSSSVLIGLDAFQITYDPR